ncbi:MAG: hypothetical protein V3T20_08525 [Gemmatimonadota bacterium]
MRRMLILCALALLLVPCLAQADIAEIMSYQGVLRDAGGNPVSDGSYLVSFRIYDVETGGTALWVENQTLTAEGGIINAHLGSVVTLTTLEFDVPYWLGIGVEHEAELVPRTPFTTVPYAATAGSANHCDNVDDHDWETSGDDLYRGIGNVGIGTVTPDVRLDVFEGDGPCARFENGSAGMNFTVRAVNNGGNAGGFFAGLPPLSYPATPAAVYGAGGPGYNGGHFTSEGEAAVFAAAPNGKSIWAHSTSGYSGYFTGGGMGVYVADLLETDQFRMQPGMGYGYVLTSDGSGYGTWQPAAAISDGDWTVAASDMYSAVSGRVGIGLTLPTAKLEVLNNTTEEAIEAKHGGATAYRVVNIERTSLPASGNDLLQLRIPSGSPADCQFIEAEYGGNIAFAVDGDGSIWSSGSAGKQAEVFSSSVTNETKVMSGIVTGTGFLDPVGVYGESIPSDGYGIGGEFWGGYRGVVGAVFPNVSGFYRGVYGYVASGSGSYTGTNYAVYGNAVSGASNYGVYGTASGGTVNYAGYFNGHAHVTGTFTAGVKSFKIDHPLDPESKYLVHSCVESDDMMNIYNGNVTLDAGGEAWVEMPEWFEALNQDFRYQLTCIGGFAPVYVAETIRDNRFAIAGGEPGMAVSWQVTGVRHDPLAVTSRSPVEVDKLATEVGKYMHPEAYGMPVTAGVDYHEDRGIPSGTAAERTARPVRDRSDGD